MKKILIRNATLFLVVIFFWLLGLSCPIKLLFNIPCPTCGMSRAVWALLRLDFKEYIDYNLMTVFVLFAVVILSNSEYIKNKKLKNSAYIVLTVNFIYYLIRLFFFGGNF